MGSTENSALHGARTKEPTRMTTIERTRPTGLVAVTHDLYRDIHKAIRSELFAVVTEAARIDPAAGMARAALAAQVRDVVQLLEDHAEHEDGAIQPVLETELPDLADRIAADHEALGAHTDLLLELAAEVALLDATDPALRVHHLHLELAAFTGAYLGHQDVEERVVMPALEATVGPERGMEIHQQILAAIPPQEMAKSVALMLPAMNVDGRTEMLGGMQANAPAEVFEGMWGLAASVLDPCDLAAVAQRLGLA
jgi:hypothetical protein